MPSNNRQGLSLPRCLGEKSVNQTALGRKLGYLMSVVSYAYQVIPLAESRLMLFFYYGLLGSLATRLPEEVIWQQQLQNFSCKHILLSKKYKYFYEFYSETILTGFCSVQKVIPPSPFHYAVVKSRRTTLLGSMLSLQSCSAVLTVPKGQQPVLPCQQ